MDKRRELTGNRVVSKGNPVRDRIVRAKRREVDSIMKEMIDGPRKVEPFRGTAVPGLDF